MEKKKRSTMRQSAVPPTAALGRRERLKAIVDEGLRKYDKLWKSLAKK